uniref:Addiction module component, TIGR02574 family n=1 Tax=Chlorobium chlorochromatii (strain CaD3) TaxID=340177 RepID=Q3AQZ2_CHLCH
MLAHAQQIYDEALTLSPIEKVELIEHLYFSLDSKNSRQELDKLWAEEAEDRLTAYENGEIKTTPASEVFAEINSMRPQ